MSDSVGCELASGVPHSVRVGLRVRKIVLLPGRSGKVFLRGKVVRTNINNCVIPQLLPIYINDIFIILLTVHK